MYKLHDYGRMTTDKVRVDAYSRAMKAAIKPGDVVVDLGAGAGYFSILACKLGAKKVYAIEPEDSIWVAKATAKELGYEDRVECIQAYSTDIDLPEKADMIVSDLRGGLSVFFGNVSSVRDARARFLRPGGALLPLRDTLHVALVESASVAHWVFGPWTTELGEFGFAHKLTANTFHRPPTELLTESCLVSDSPAWATVDYHAATAHQQWGGKISLAVNRDASAHGLAIWFDAEIAPGIGFSNRPLRPDSAYSTFFLPFESALPVKCGEILATHLQATDDGTTWAWEVQGANGSRKQATLGGQVPLPDILGRISGTFRPFRRREDRAADRAKSLCDGTRSLREIAEIVTVENNAVSLGDAAVGPLRFSSAAESTFRRK